MTTYYVSLSGSDDATGSKADPFATLARALEATRALGTAAEPRISVGGGRYVDVALTLDARDSGLIIEAAEGETPILCGGHEVTGWRQEGQFWVADLPEGAARARDARMLEVNGRFCPRARLPEEGAFTHESVFDVRWMSTTLGGWERKPTQEELTTLKYREGDLGAWLEPGNAELTIYHSWDDSMVGVAAVDEVTRTVHFSTPAGHPAGGFGGHIPKANTYVVWNVREGMTRPGQWYLDRVRGQVVYWPLPGEDPATVVAYLPIKEAIVTLRSSEDAPLEGLVLRGLGFTIANAPMIAGDFAAMRLPGAIDALGSLTACRFENLHIWNVAGHGIRLRYDDKHRDIVVSGCVVEHTGAGGIYLNGDRSLITENLVQHIGLIYPAAIGIFGGGDGYVISHNDVYDTSYTAINGGGGKGSVIEYNDMARAMQVLEDGAAIYVIFATELVMRGNVAHDIPDAHGCHAYYLDEQSERCIVTGNLAVNVPSASQNHWARHCRIENNVFISEGEVRLHFPRSEDFTIAHNVIWAPGGVQFRNADAVAHYENNICFTGANQIEAVRYVDGLYRPLETLELASGRDLLNADPCFMDAEGGDFRFQPGSPALDLGIPPIDVSKAGRTRR
jgi:hypothetical protein